MLEFLYLFFIPVLCVNAGYRRRGQRQRFTPQLLTSYCSAAITIHLAARIILTLVALFTPYTFALDGLTYGIVATVIAVGLSYIQEFFRKLLSVRVSVTNSDEEE